jgi:hypothetical protein
MRTALVLLLSFNVASPALAAATPEARCQAAKTRAAGAYAKCLQDAAAKLVLSGDADKHQAAVLRCAAAIGAQFTKAEDAAAKKGAACPTTGDATDLGARVDGDAAIAADAVAPGGALPACGDGVIDAVGEQCDQSDLGGATCAELGGHPDGTLSCDGSCRFATSGCVSDCAADGGVDAPGICWMLATSNTLSCDAVCAATGRTCNLAATRNHAGSGGDLETCETLVEALVPGTAGNPGTEGDTGCGPEGALGCVLLPSSSHAIRLTGPVTTCSADGQGDGCATPFLRVCGCD